MRACGFTGNGTPHSIPIPQTNHSRFIGKDNLDKAHAKWTIEYNGLMKASKRNGWWLLAPLFAGLLLIWVLAVRHSRQNAAIGHIENLGGRVLTTHGEPNWLLRWTGGRSFHFFDKATLVNLSETATTDADLVSLEHLNGPQRLNLGETNITGKGLEHLEGCMELKALDLTGTDITGSGLKHLRHLSQLEYLYLQGTDVER